MMYIKPAAHESKNLLSKNPLVTIVVSKSPPCGATIWKFLFTSVAGEKA